MAPVDQVVSAQKRRKSEQSHQNKFYRGEELKSAKGRPRPVTGISFRLLVAIELDEEAVGSRNQVVVVWQVVGCATYKYVYTLP